MASFFVPNNTSGIVHSSQFPARCQGKKPAILTGFRISLMIVAADRQKLAWLLNENCSASIICVSFSSSCKYFFVMGRDNSEKRRRMKRPEKTGSHTCFSNSGNCGSVLVIVNKGTLEPKKRHWKLSLHQILQVVCFCSFKENFVDAEGKFSSHLTKLFLARATARADL